jgi:solute carrier family 8 (sodium/calcium exchanger)
MDPKSPVLFFIFQGKNFEVPAGSLSFSVVIFTILSLVTMALLITRRSFSIFGNAELGGPKGPKIITGIFLICLWFLYVLIASLQSYEHIPGF